MSDRVLIRDNSYPSLINEAILGQRSEFGVTNGSIAENTVFLHCSKGQTLLMNKLILVSISKFMVELLRDHEVYYREEPHIVLEDMDIDVLKHIVEFAHTGEATIPAENADQIYEASQRLGIKFLKDSFVRLDHQDYEDIRAGRKQFNLQQYGQSYVNSSITVQHESSDTESAESNDIDDVIKQDSPGKGKIFSQPSNSHPPDNNVVFTINPSTQTPSFAVKMDQAQKNTMRPVQLPHSSRGPIQYVLQRPTAIQPKQIDMSQPVIVRRPDGRLVKIVRQRPSLQPQVMTTKPLTASGMVFQPRKLSLPRGVQIQPKPLGGKSVPTSSLTAGIVVPGGISNSKPPQMLTVTRPSSSNQSVNKLPFKESPKTNIPPVFTSPAKMAPLTVSEPRLTIPATVPDDFLDEEEDFPEPSDTTKIASDNENVAPRNDVDGEPSNNNADDSLARRSGRERKLNKKYADEETELDDVIQPKERAENVTKPETVKRATVDKRKQKEEIETKAQTTTTVPKKLKLEEPSSNKRTVSEKPSTPRQSTVKNPTRDNNVEMESRRPKSKVREVLAENRKFTGTRSQSSKETRSLRNKKK